MKRFISLATVLLVAGISSGQDSLEIVRVGDIPGGHVLFANDSLMVGIELFPGDYDMGMVKNDTARLVIYDNSDPENPLALWRGLDGVWSESMGVWLDVWEYSDAEIRDSLLYTVRSFYEVVDVPYSYFTIQLICYDWVHDDTLSIISHDVWDELGNEWYGGLPNGLIVRGNRIAVGLGCLGFQVLDYSDPRNPEVIARRGLPSYNVVEIGQYLLTVNSNNIALCDFNNPEIPVSEIMNEWAVRSDYADVGISGNTIFLQGDEAIAVLNVSNDNQLEFTRLWNFGEWIPGLDVSGDTLAIALERSFELWKVADPENPELLSSVEYEDRFRPYRDIQLRGPWIYLSSTERYEAWNMELFHIGQLAALQEKPIPTGFILHSPYPNPFNSLTMLRYELPSPMKVRMDLLDLGGQRVQSQMVFGMTGMNSMVFDAANLSSGSYIINVNTARGSLSTPITLIR